MAIKTKFGVMGSAGGEFAAEIMDRAFRLGEEIARHDCASSGCLRRPETRRDGSGYLSGAGT